MAQTKDFRMTATFAVRDQMSSTMKAIAARWSGLKDTLESTSFRNLERAFRSFDRQLKNTGDSARDMAESLAVPFGILAGVVGAAAHQAVFGFSEVGTALDNMSRQVGTPVERLQELTYAASQFGAESDVVQDALKTLNEYIVEIGTGDNEELASLFTALGISVRDANGQLRTAADILPEFADGLQRNDNIALQTKMAIAAFGDEAGVKLLPLLKQGSGALEAYAAEAHRLGMVMSDEDTQAATEMQRSFTNLRGTLSGLTNTIGAALAPTVTRIAERFREMTAANREAFADRFVAVAERFAQTLEKFDFERLVNGLLRLADAVTTVIDGIGGFNTLIEGIGIFLGGKALMSVVNFGSSLFALGQSFVALLPAIQGFAATAAAALGMSTGGLAFVIMGIGAAAGYVVRNWEAIGPVVEDVISGVTDFAKEAWATWGPNLKEVCGGLVDIFTGVFTLDFPKVLQGASTTLEAMGKTLVQSFTGLFNLLPDSWKEAWTNLMDSFDFSALVPDFVKELFGGDSSETPAPANLEPAESPYAQPAAIAATGGVMTGRMTVDVYGHDADVGIRSIQSSDNLAISGAVGRSNRSGGD